MEYQKESVTLNVSRLDDNGFWLGNQDEHVAKGTALGAEFTENIYTPSKAGMIGKYDRKTNSWTEIKNRALDEFWNETGEGFVIGTPDGEFPDWAVTEKPPEFDTETQTCLYKDGAWKIYSIQIGRTYWTSEAIEQIVTEYNFELPDNHSWVEPPAPLKGYSVRLVNGEWVQIKDYRGQVIFNTADKSTKQVDELGDIETGWTLDVPPPYSKWQSGQWVQQLDLMQTAKREEINQWRTQEENADTTIEVFGKLWNANATARKRIESTLASTYMPPFWTDANDNDNAITREELEKIYDAIVQYDFLIHARQREMKEEIKKLATVKEVDNYVIGWPVNNLQKEI